MLLAVALVASLPSKAEIVRGNESLALAQFTNGEIISGAELHKYIESRLDLRGRVQSLTQARRALREMVLTRTLNLEAPEVGVEQLSDRRGLRFDDVLAQAVANRLMVECEPLPDEAAARVYFQEHPDEFSVPAAVRLVRLKLPAGAVLDGQPALAWLGASAEKLRQDETALDRLIDKAESAYPDELQGDLGWILAEDRNDDPIVVRLNESEVGEWVGPVQGGSFVYLFQVKNRRNEQKLTWEQTKNSVPQQALNGCRNRRERALQEKMFEKYGVTFDEAALQQLYQ